MIDRGVGQLSAVVLVDKWSLVCDEDVRVLGFLGVDFKLCQNGL